MTGLSYGNGRLVVQTGDRRMSILVSAYDSVTPEQRAEIAGRLVGYARRDGHDLSPDQEREFRSRFP